MNMNMFVENKQRYVCELNILPTKQSICGEMDSFKRILKSIYYLCLTSFINIHIYYLAYLFVFHLLIVFV